jgi:hypothetical protein
MLDRLPALLRHAALVALAAVLGVAVEALPSLDLDPVLASIVGAVLTLLVAWVTPLTRQYGIGKPKPADVLDDGAYSITDLATSSRPEAVPAEELVGEYLDPDVLDERS